LSSPFTFLGFAFPLLSSYPVLHSISQMSSTGAGYDLGVNTYSPDGRVYQVDYALKASDNAGCAVGLKCKDGVVMGVEKIVKSKLLVEGSNRR